MSGPVSTADAGAVDDGRGVPTGPTVELFESRAATVGALPIRRALPRRGHRTLGAWCFADHMGPAAVTPERGVDIGPHPHCGLQTVTWLAAGEILHRDSLGTEQPIRPGQLNLMTAGAGVSHSEEGTGRYRGEIHGIQLWVAQPSSTRDGDPAFEHHAELPGVEVGVGGAVGTVLVGSFAGVASPARRDTDHVGVDLALAPGSGPAVLPLVADHEHGVVVLSGAVDVAGTVVEPGRLAYLGTGRDELPVSAPGGDGARFLLLGGAPFGEDVLMWWNFVARTREEVAAAQASWNADDGRFGTVASPLDRIPAPDLPWR